MARQKGMLNLSGNLEPLAGAPLDSRTITPTVADLYVASNWPYKYIGMKTTVIATGDTYRLVNLDVTQESSWVKEGGDLGTAAAKDSTDSVTAGSTDLVESGAVKEAIDTAVASAGLITPVGGIVTVTLPASSVSGYYQFMLPSLAFALGKTVTIGSANFAGNSTEMKNYITPEQFGATDSGKAYKIADENTTGVASGVYRRALYIRLDIS